MYGHKINPLRAVAIKYKNTDYPVEDLNSVNSDCYSICGAFSETDNVYDVDPHCAKMCKSLIDVKRRELYGVGECDHQQPYKPLIFGDYPFFFPKFLKQGYSPEESLEKCKSSCSAVPNLQIDCEATCKLHYDAVEPNTPVSSKPQKKVSFSPSTEFKETQDCTESNHNWILFLILCIFVIFLVLFYNK